MSRASLCIDLSGVSLYDLLVVMGEAPVFNACLAPGYPCPRRERKGHCEVHEQLCGLQQRLHDELRAHSLRRLLTGRE